MNKLKLKSKYNETDLEAALIISAQAADDLKVSASDLVERLLNRLHSKTTNCDERLQPETHKKICNIEAGP